ncbi:TolC family protein, partial [Candidatus Methylacidithermus pantelleriae]|uniref:TolC family protein n=1 Tax=Candidatus Methylacidithermus pantelleriae TaxID=2744239 RepID=UPI00157E0520
ANAAIASDLTQTLYHEGKKTVADVVQMRLQKEQAEAALRENLLRILSLRARLYFLSGRLDDSNVMVLMRDIFP